MADNIRWGLDTPHPFSQMKTEPEAKLGQHPRQIRQILKFTAIGGEKIAKKSIFIS